MSQFLSIFLFISLSYSLEKEVFKILKCFKILKYFILEIRTKYFNILKLNTSFSVFTSTFKIMNFNTFM